MHTEAFTLVNRSRFGLNRIGPKQIKGFILSVSCCLASICTIRSTTPGAVLLTYGPCLCFFFLRSNCARPPLRPWLYLLSKYARPSPWHITVSDMSRFIWRLEATEGCRNAYHVHDAEEKKQTKNDRHP
jgi:hypothetical protein